MRTIYKILFWISIAFFVGYAGCKYFFIKNANKRFQEAQKIEKTNTEEALSLYKQACFGNNPNGCLLAGEILYSENAYRGAYRYYIKGCELKDGYACYSAGFTFLNHIFEKYENTNEKNLYRKNLSLDLFKLGCELGSIESCAQFIRIEGKRKSYYAIKKEADYTYINASSEFYQKIKEKDKDVFHHTVFFMLYSLRCWQHKLDGCIDAINYAEKHNKWNVSFNIYKEACSLKNPDACYLLKEHWGESYLRDLCKAGNKVACYQLY